MPERRPSFSPSNPDLIRIGDKLIQRSRISRFVDRLLERRQAGLSQLEAARELGVDRTLVSRLESIGEVRRGERIALIGFPIANHRELTGLAYERGVDLVLLMSNSERWSFLEDKDGPSLFNEVMAVIAQVQRCDKVIFLGSDMRVALMEDLVGANRLVSVVLGPSPMHSDHVVDRDELARLLDGVLGTGDAGGGL